MTPAPAPVTVPDTPPLLVSAPALVPAPAPLLAPLTQPVLASCADPPIPAPFPLLSPTSPSLSFARDVWSLGD